MIRHRWQYAELDSQNFSAGRFQCEGFDRRGVLLGGGTIGFSSLLGVLLGSGRPSLAAPILGNVPELDRVVIRVVVEDFQFAVAPSKTVGDVKLENFGWGLGPDRPPGPTLISEFGLSMYAETHRGAESRILLVDFGFTSNALNTNLNLLGIEPDHIDALVLSHGHYDHFGGLAGFLASASGRLKSNLPLYIGGEDCFCARQWTGPPSKGDFGVIDRQALQAAKLSIISTPQPSLVAEHAFTSGRIPTQSFEKLKSPSVMRLGVHRGSGCDASKISGIDRSQSALPDQFDHEIATAFHLKGKGLIIMTSCSHRGMINAVQRAQEVSGVSDVYAIIGGFHLAPYPDDYVSQTVEALMKINPAYVFPLHCSGEAFYDKARAAMPGKVIRAFTGTQITFNA